MEDRLQKILSARGIASRREAERMIEAGQVTVDGEPAQLGQRADPDKEEICVNGQLIPAQLDKRVYIMLNKPIGYVTTVRDEQGRRTVMELLGDAGTGLWPVGRLDLNSKGLLLLTNDGEVTRRLTHPSFCVEKTYRVSVRGEDIPQAVKRMTQPLVIDGRPIAPAKVRLIRDQGTRGLIEVCIREGRNRQVRKMCGLCGLKVFDLTRIAEGGLRLGNLENGEWRYLKQTEIEYLSSI